jgi:hypothetical protein
VIPGVSSLRASRHQTLVTPAPPDNPYFKKVSRAQTRMLCFYDSMLKNPPKTWNSLLKTSTCKYVEVRFSDTESSPVALSPIDTSTINPPTITVPGFSSLDPMIKGTDRITTQLAVMELGLLRDFDRAPLPLKQARLG